MRDSAGQASNRLYALVMRDQWRNIALFLPTLLLLNIACAASIHRWPEIFLAHNGHIWLVGAQLICFVGYLMYVVRFYARLAPLIADAHAEWHAANQP